MKILYQSRVDLYNPRGGDTSQIENTKEAIEKLYPAIKIDIKPVVKEPDIEKYDLVHLFNLDWICETHPQAKWAKKHKKKIVLSAIHHSEEEVKRYEELARYDIRRLYNALIPWQSLRDTGKNFYRSLHHPAKFIPSVNQLIAGIRNQQREVLKMSDIVLVQTNVEAEDIKKDFRYSDFKWEKVVNGVNISIFDKSDPGTFDTLTGLVSNPILLNVGRIEPRKNQFKLIKAFVDLQHHEQLKNWKLVFIGDMGKHSYEYNYRFNKLVSANENVLYIGRQPSEVVASAMAHKGVYVHPSWFETTGLVTLEASLAGMNIVASGERVKEYLEDNAKYCDPASVESIKNAILEASESVFSNSVLQKQIREQYSWDETAKQTLEVYKALLN